jgi:hypothetical protein
VRKLSGNGVSGKTELAERAERWSMPDVEKLSTKVPMLREEERGHGGLVAFWSEGDRCRSGVGGHRI